MIVALVAAFAFSACGPISPDEALILKIQKYKTYAGADNDGDAVTATFNADAFMISYDDIDLVLSGKWTVTGGFLIMTGEDDWAPGIINNDGKDLIISDTDGMVYSVSAKK